MKKEAELTGTEIVSKTAEEYTMPTMRSFNDTMTEARELWNKIVAANGDDGKAKMHDIITHVFGRDVQLSKVPEEQQELVELVIDDFKKLI